MENRDEKLDKKDLSADQERPEKNDASEFHPDGETSLRAEQEKGKQDQQISDQFAYEKIVEENNEEREDLSKHHKGLSIFSEKGQGLFAELKKEETIDINAYAGFWIRFCAYIVDLLIIASLRLMIVRPIVLLFNLESGGFFSLEKILSAIIFFGYFVLLTGFTGQTLGKMIFGLRVTSLNGERLTWDTVIFRELVGRYICYKIKILYVLVGILPKKQGLHDYFADTCVVHEEVVNKKSVEQLLRQQL